MVPDCWGPQGVAAALGPQLRRRMAIMRKSGGSRCSMLSTLDTLLVKGAEHQRLTVQTPRRTAAWCQVGGSESLRLGTHGML